MRADWKKIYAVLKFFAFAGIFLIFSVFLASCSNRGGIDLDPVEQKQYFFPHGHDGPLLLDGNNVIHSASWTRGDGVTIFDISNADNPRYAAGFLSAGYAFDMLEHNDYYYIATCYSIFIIRKKDNVMVENLLISFPEGKVTQLAIAGNILYCSSPDGLREYDILDNGRLMFRTVRTELIDLAAMAASGDIVYLVKKTEPQKILKINAKDGKVQTAFENFNTKIQSIIAVSGKVYAVCGKHLLDQDGKILLPHVDMTAAYAAGKDKIMVMGKENNAGKISAKMIYLLNGADGGIIRKIEAGDIESRSFTTDGERLVWHSNSGIKVASLDDLQQQIDIPVIRNESAIVVVPPYVYSFDRGGGSEGIMRLYGFDLRKKQDLQKQVFDINLTWEYTKDQPGFYYDIVLQPFDYLKVDNKYLFVPGALLDISDPGKPELLDTSLALASTYAINEKKQIFLTQGSKLTVLDGTKLPEIKVIAQIPADKSEKKAMWSDVVVEGDYLYSNERTKLVVYHVADITNPKKVATLMYPEKSNVYKTIKVGQYLYCPGYSFWDDSQNPLLIVDLADPEKPVIVKSVKDWPTKSLLDMVIYQGKLYGASGTRVFRCDLTDPLNPVEDKNWTAPDKAMQGYYYIDACDGILAAKKYPRIDAWRIEE